MTVLAEMVPPVNVIPIRNLPVAIVPTVNVVPEMVEPVEVVVAVPPKGAVLVILIKDVEPVWLARPSNFNFEVELKLNTAVALSPPKVTAEAKVVGYTLMLNPAPAPPVGPTIG